MDLKRRNFIGAGAALATALATGLAQRAQAQASPAGLLGDGAGLGLARPFAHADLIARAEAAARAPYSPPYRPMPEVTQAINYEEHGKIRFRTDAAPFQAEAKGYPLVAFHLGQYFQKSVKLHLVSDGQAREFTYSPALFDMPEDSPARALPADSGFAGFRLQEWAASPDWRSQDWVAFLGASYFRSIGASGQYGLSARGIALNSALPDRPEEFPDFTEFYIGESSAPEAPVVISAYLDGPSVTGAFRFNMTRGLDRSRGVEMEIEAAIFLREDIGRLGLIPLTSMFWFGEYGRERIGDWRPEVHDSDGLAIWTGTGERIWRPLNNPIGANVSAFGDENPKGFGLLQRDRNFDHYRDGVFYDRRPSLWVEPIAPLGRGSVQLLEFGTNDEIHDNIGAFWVPEAPALAGNRYDLHYRLHWKDSEPYPAENIAQTVSTRIGRGGQPGHERPADVYKFAVEFDRPSVLTRLPYGVFPEVNVTTSAGTIGRVMVEPVPNGNVWRAFFDLTLPADQLAELRLYMALDGQPLTETWLYQFDRRNLVGAF